jgi:diguanylate cyclase (GGDEF)-like protein
VTIQYENERQLQRLAYNDALTGFPRRAILDNSLPAIIESCDRKGEWAAVLLFDIDRFKLLNGSHWQYVGDAILVEAANLLECNMLDTNFVYRYGRDEFVIVANDLGANLSQATKYAQALARKIRSSLEESYKLRRLQLSATSSIGIALIEPGKSVAEEILTTADDAMYVGKRRGGNTVFIANKGSSCEAPPPPLKGPLAMSA